MVHGIGVRSHTQASAPASASASVSATRAAKVLAMARLVSPRMPSARPAIHVVEWNPYAPRPFVFSEVAVCLRDAIRAAGYDSEHLQNRIDPQSYSIVLGLLPDKAGELEHPDPAGCAIFNFEQLGTPSSIPGPEYRRWLADWLVLDYHGSNIAILQRENGSQQQ